MRRLLIVLIALTCAGCKPKTAVDAKFDADLKSGPDGKRSGAQVLTPNTPVTDEVNFLHQDKSDWYVVQLPGHAGVLNTLVHWDNGASDIQIDVFDAFGKQISASPVRNPGAKEKSLLTQIDRPGTYYVRVTAPTAQDGSVYTMEAKWDMPPPAPPPPPPVVAPMPMAETPPPPRRHREREHREPREPRERPTGESVEGSIVSAYREGGGLTLQLDKGSAAGLRPGATGTVLDGPSGQTPLSGGDFRVVSVLGPNKSIAKSQIHSLGRNTRVLITLGR